jgi:hypothetical protein
MGNLVVGMFGVVLGLVLTGYRRISARRQTAR